MKNTTNHKNMNSTLSHQLQSKHIAKLFVLAIMLLTNLSVFSQPGKDGALTISTTNTVLNRYTRVTADIPIGSNSVTVVNINELNRDGITYLPSGYNTNSSSFASNAIVPGDLILLFQAQGAIINTTNSIDYGAVTSLNNCGRYEMAYVGSVSGNTITLDCKTRFAYFSANYVQCVRIPQYTTLTVNSGASVVPIRWGDPAFGGADPSAVTRRRGGFLGVLADDIVNEGSINANYAGFRGGTFFNGSPASGDVFYSDYFYNVTSRAGEKGEGIAGYRPDYDALGGRYGMGAPANAGGGGNGHNCGGGGGANGGDPADWFRGAGVMNHFGTCGNPGAWALDPNYIANGNALTNSTGGGRGGYSYSASNANACTSGPSYPANFISPGVPLIDVLNTAWGGDRRKALGGLGGRPLVSPAIDRQIFFGGGGGAGDGNNNASSDGGDGGGIVFLVVENSVTGSGVIQANGEAGSSTRGAVGNDAPGGGGGGGTILVQANSVSSGIAINADGGNGGIQTINLGNEGEGPGGGGSGGAIYMNSPSDASTKTVNGGANGTTNSLGTTEFIANGATSGNVGSLRTASVEINFNLCLTDLEIIKTVDDLSPKFGDNVTFTLTASNLGQNDATNVVVNDILPSGYTFVSSNPSVGTYNNATGIWTIGNLNYPSSSETLEIVATVNLTGTYANTATISADEPDPEPANNTSTVTPIPSDCNAGPASSSPSVCINSAMTPITHATTAATGIGTPTGLPTGVTASWSADVITISGTPTVSGVFNYSIPLETGCDSEVASGTITVILNTATASINQTLCENTALTPMTHTTTGATGIGTPTGLPAGVSASWSVNIITISGTPTASGTFNYTIPLTGGCDAGNATGTITVTNTTNTVSAPSSTPSRCVNLALTPITHTTTGATGIGTPTGLPPGVSASWSANTITIFSSPTATGVYNYSIPLIGGCGTVNATGTITVNGATTVSATTTRSVCVDVPITDITRTTTFGTSIGTPSGLPPGLSASFSSNVLTISGTPTAVGTYNYTITVVGPCSNVNATGTIIVVDENTPGTASSNPTLCINTALTAITRTTGAATGIGTPTGLPAGTSAAWNNNIITITGTPTEAGTFNYTIPLTGGCGDVDATGTITVNPLNTASAGTTTTLCVNTALSPVITHTTTGATGIHSSSGLPTGVSASWSANTITLSGTPTSSGTSNYSVRLNGGCGTIYATGTIVRTANNTVAAASNPTLCINTAMTTINRATTGATGIANAGVSGANGLPTGVSATWASNILTISGTPTVAGTFNYSIALTGGCGTVNATGTITVTAANTVSAASSSPTLCISTAMTAITHSTTGATGRGTATGLPSGLTSTWSANVLTISGTPTQSGTFNYSIPLTGGCVTTPATGTIIVTANNTAGTAPTNPNICVNTALTPLTRTTTGATGIGTATGLPAGVSASWSANTLTVSGTPTGTGTFNYTIPLTGGCGTVNATGTITVVSQNTVSGTSGQTVCVNSAVSITRPTTGATGIGSATGLPSGVSASWSANSISITGTPTVAGTYNYTVPLSGGCGSAVNATGMITVNSNKTASAPSSTPTLCINTALTSITHTTTGATGISNSGVSGANGLPTGVSATWASNTITISGTPSVDGTFNYSIPLTGGCGSVNATGTITVVSSGNGGSISGGGVTVCSGTNSTTLTLSGYTGSIVKWQYSTVSDFSSGVTDVSNSTTTLTATNLTSTRYYRAVVGGGSCTEAYSTSATINVNATSSAGTISGPSEACLNLNSSLLTVTGEVGTIQWQSSINNSTFNNISGETSSTYTASNLSSTTYYRVVVTNGVCGSATSASHTITVVNPSVSASLSSGDYVWKGSGANSTDSVDWLVPSNWYVYNGSSFAVASTLPTVEINVFIPSVGTCFQANPHIFTSTAPICKNLTILSSGHLTMHTGKLSVGGNWVNNGIFTCGTGEVIFIEKGYHTIGGTVSVNAFYDFRMNKPADGGTKSVAYLLKQATISGTMTLTAGLFDINVFSIDMDNRAVVGGSPASYVRTSSTGFLRRTVHELEGNVEGSHVRFPIGRSNYNPAHLNNFGTSDIIGVRVFDKVTDDSYEESPLTALPAVERTWMIEEGVVGGSDVDMQLYWNGTLEARNEEINSFDYNTAYIAHYDYSGVTWEDKGGSAPSGPGYAQQNGITSFSPFTISSRHGLGYISPLPVELIDFKATCLEDKTVRIDWNTASENNSNYYDVMKSTNGTSWKVLENVPAAGNSNSLLNYQVFDRELSFGNVYYKLKQVDIDGKFKMYDVININCDESITQDNLNAYPNPSSSEFNIDFNSVNVEGEGQIVFTDSKGLVIYSRKVQVGKGSNFFTIDELKASPGLYYISLTSNKFTSNIVKHIIR
jgi:hypothetical protein